LKRTNQKKNFATENFDARAFCELTDLELYLRPERSVQFTKKKQKKDTLPNLFKFTIIEELFFFMSRTSG
jgi:hypothetical protein